MQIHGKVVKGLGLGAKLGYPTANLECGNVELPAPGVYAARATVDGVIYNAALIIGARTEKCRPLIEVLLLDFDGDLYGKELEVKVLKAISVIERFEHDEGLKNKIAEDMRQIRAYFDSLRQKV